MNTQNNGLSSTNEQDENAIFFSPEGPLCRLIKDSTGIKIYPHQINKLQKVIYEACQRFGFSSRDELIQSLLNKPGLSLEMEFLVSNMTVGESYFFRDMVQMDLLREYLLPELIERKRKARDLSLRIWSAGCSEGQEIYSIAILLNELIPDIDLWKQCLLATDINTEVLALAVKGRYREFSFRALPASIKQKYFTQNGHEYLLDEKIRKLAQFNYLNLADDVYPASLTDTCSMDLILCRNVFIYIEPTISEQILNRFAACLAPDGFLLTGPSDFVRNVEKYLSYCQVKGTAYYRKKLPVHSILPDVMLNEIVPPAIAPSYKNKVVKKTGGGVRPTAISQSKNQGKSTLSSSKKQLDVRLKSLMLAHRWYDVLMLTEQSIAEAGATVNLLQTSATALANLGRKDEALKRCDQCLAQDPMDKHTYLIKGLVLMELDRLSEAEVIFRKSLYLDHLFIESHYQLALLLLRRKQYEAALKSFANVLELAKKCDPLAEVQSAPGITYGAFVEILNKEIAIYTATLSQSS